VSRAASGSWPEAVSVAGCSADTEDSAVTVPVAGADNENNSTGRATCSSSVVAPAVCESAVKGRAKGEMGLGLGVKSRVCDPISAPVRVAPVISPTSCIPEKTH
jgi:hypothetical protein